jgi:hypothetical protein
VELETALHPLPVSCSISGCWLPPAIPDEPTAQQSPALVQVTAWSRLLVLPGGLGLETIFQPLPVYCSTSVS